MLYLNYIPPIEIAKTQSVLESYSHRLYMKKKKVVVRQQNTIYPKVVS